MNDPAKQTGAALPDAGVMMIGPLSMLRMWADVNRAMASVMPASLLIASSPFFWAPPLWVGALMAGHGAVQGSTATPPPSPPRSAALTALVQKEVRRRPAAARSFTTAGRTG